MTTYAIIGTHDSTDPQVWGPFDSEQDAITGVEELRRIDRAQDYDGWEYTIEPLISPENIR